MNIDKGKKNKILDYKVRKKLKKDNYKNKMKK